MPVLPDFQPENASYGRSGGAYIGAMQEGQSMMARAQAMQIQQAQDNRAQLEYQAKLPAIQAQAQADIATAHASVENAALVEQFRTKAASESKDLNDTYLKAIALPSFDEQASALSALQPRVAYMDQLPEYKGFVNAVNTATVRAHSSAIVDRQLNNKLDVQGAKNEGAIETAKVRQEMAEKAQAEREAHAKEMADLRFTMQQSKLDQTGNTEYLKERGKAQAAIVADVQGRVQQHYATLDQTSRARALIDQDAEQGRGVATVLGVQQAINSFLPGTFDTSKQETLKQSYAEMALSAAAKMKGQGSITEAERALLSDSTAKFGNSPQAAKYIMDFMDAVARREIKRAEYYSDVEDDGKMVTGKLTTDFYRQNPISKFIQSAIPQVSGQKGQSAEPLKVLSITQGG